MAYRPDSEFKEAGNGFFSSDTFVKSYTFYVKPRFPIETEVKLVIWVIDDLGSPGARERIRTDDELANVSGYKPDGTGKPYPRDGNKALIGAFFNLPNTNPKNGDQLTAKTFDGFYLNLDPSKSNMDFQLPGYYSAQAMFDKGEWSGGSIKPTSTDTYIDLAINTAQFSYKKIIYQLPLTGEADLPNFNLPENKVEFEQREETPPPPPPGPTGGVVASQIVTPTPPPEAAPAPPPPGKLYNAIIFNVEKNNILVPTQNTFDLGELNIVKRDYAPPLPVSTNLPPTGIGEFSNMAPTDVPPTAPAGKSSPSGFPISGTSFRVANRQPTQIVLHYTAGWQVTDKNQGTVNFLQSRNNGRGLTYHFIIAVDGHIENLVDPKNVAYHGTDSNQNSIGISLAGLGTTFHSKNTLASADAQIDKLKSKSLYRLNEYHAELVDFDEKKSPYRGSLKFSQEVSDAQLRSLSSLLKKLRQDFPTIPAWNGLTQDTFDLMFPRRGTTYQSDKPGLYSHCSITTQKADVLPTPRLIKFLKQVRF